VVTGDGRWVYTLVSGPDGWFLGVNQAGFPLEHWVCVYGDSEVSEATIVVRYAGGLDIGHGQKWILTNDGDNDPTDGIIAGEGGFDAVAPVNIGVNSEAKVALHILPRVDSRTCSSDFPVIEDAGDILTTCAGTDVHFFPVFYDLVEYMGMEYGIIWHGSHSCLFRSCSDLTIGTIRYPSGTVSPEDQTDWVAHAWTNCQAGPVAIPGFGWITETEPGMICMVAATGTGHLWVMDCRPELKGVNEPVCNFCAGIGGVLGDDLSGPASTENTSWGKIKHMFR
jgi:hypothetical protein